MGRHYQRTFWTWMQNGELDENTTVWLSTRATSIDGMEIEDNNYKYEIGISPMEIEQYTNTWTIIGWIRSYYKPIRKSQAKRILARHLGCDPSNEKNCWDNIKALDHNGEFTRNSYKSLCYSHLLHSSNNSNFHRKRKVDDEEHSETNKKKNINLPTQLNDENQMIYNLIIQKPILVQKQDKPTQADVDTSSNNNEDLVQERISDEQTRTENIQPHNDDDLVQENIQLDDGNEEVQQLLKQEEDSSENLTTVTITDPKSINITVKIIVNKIK